MAKEKVNLRDELREHKFEFDLLQKIPCTKQENKTYEKLLEAGCALPEGVFPYEYESGTATDEFYTVYEADLTETEIQEYLTYKQLHLIRTIKNCVMFFTILTIASMVGTTLCFFFAMMNFL